MIPLRPKLTLTTLINFPNDSKFRAGKARAFKDYLDWFYAPPMDIHRQLLPESENEKIAFLEAAKTCGIFINFPHFKTSMMPLILHLRPKMQVPMYRNMLAA